MMGTLSRGCSSVGRASACHAEGRGFEPLHPLHRKGPQCGPFRCLRPLGGASDAPNGNARGNRSLRTGSPVANTEARSTPWQEAGAVHVVS
jgi:hypothetical protein